jgi:regulator of replication initiation timing
MNELKNIDIHIISLVDKGANKKNIIWKSLNPGDTSYVQTLLIQKTDEEKKIVYGIVYTPNEIDAHGDFATEAEIEKACYGFMKKSKTNSIDTQHDLDTDKNCFVGESWIVKSNDSLFPDETGAWAVGVKIENDEIWKSVISGEITGISMYGYAEKVAKEEKSDDEKIEKGIMKFFKNIFNGENKLEDTNKIKKDFNDRMLMLDFPKLLDALYSAAYDVLYDENVIDKTSGILECVDQFKTYLTSIEKAEKSTEKSVLDSASKHIQYLLEAANGASEKRTLQKSEAEKIKKIKGEIEMTPEEIKKQIDEAVKPVTEANELLKTENEELKKRLDEVEKTSKGSAQNHEDDDDEPKKEVQKSVFPWAMGTGK